MIDAEGYMVAVAAAMEAPAILSALWLVARSGSGGKMAPGLMREIRLGQLPEKRASLRSKASS